MRVSGAVDGALFRGPEGRGRGFARHVSASLPGGLTPRFALQPAHPPFVGAASSAVGGSGELARCRGFAAEAAPTETALLQGRAPATICYTFVTPGCLVRLCLHGAFGSRGTPSAAATNQNFPITTFVASTTAWLPLCLGD